MPKKNELGGDITPEYKAPTPEERGDIVVDPTENTDADNTNLDNANTDSDSTTDSDNSADTHDSDNTEADDASTTNSESEAETETDGEQSDTDHAKPDDTDDADKHKVPRSRLNKEAKKRQQAVAENKRLQEQIDALQAQLEQTQDTTDDSADTAPAKPELSVDDFKKLQAAMLDENTEEAFELFQKMLTSQQAEESPSIDKETLKEELREELRIADENERMAKRANDLAKAFPELDANHELADQDMIKEVLGLRAFYIEQGESFADALDEAVGMVAKKYELEDRTAKKAPAKKKGIDAEKKLKAAQEEQGKLEGDGTKTVEQNLDIRKMSDKQFKDLSEEARRRARGDFL